MPTTVGSLSVVVPTRNRPQELDELLASMLDDLRPDDEVIVVDSASADPAVRHVADRHKARYFRCDRPGASLARNVGWRAAAHDFIAFVDDDCLVAPGWSANLRVVLARPEVGFVAGRVDAPPNYVGGDIPIALMLGEEPRVIDRASRGSIGSSNNLGVRRCALADIDGFDERLGPATFFSAAEDLDLIDRLLSVGWTGRFEPAVLVWHRQTQSRAAKLRTAYRYGKGMGGRLSKLARVDAERAHSLRREALWANGLRTIALDLRRRYEFGAVFNTIHVIGVIVGLVVGRILL